MQRVSRLKFIIIATIACAILFCSAAFSVSLAFWSEGGDSTAEVSGESGLFYVEYPLSVTTTVDVPAPNLSDNKNYMQVTAKNNTDNTSDYYALERNNDSEDKILGLYLRDGDTLAMYNGIEPQDIGGNNTSSTSSNFTLEDGKLIVNTSGVYDFYYVLNNKTFWINRVGDSGGSNFTVNPDDYTLSFTVKFSDVDEEKTLHFNKNNFDNPCAYIWTDNGGSTKHYYNENWTVGKNTGDPIGGGNPKTMTDAGTTAVKVGAFDDTKIIFTNGGWSDQSDNLMLKDFAAEKDNYITVGSNPSCDSGKHFTGPTNFGVITTTVKTGDEKVRYAEMSGVENDDGSFTYQNYVCVSRLGDSDSDYDNTICFLTFEIVDENENQITNNSTPIKSIEITRASTDGTGNPSGGNVGTPPRLYGAENVGTLSDVNFVVKPTEDRRYPDIMVESYYNGGMYCVLFFGDYDQQYFALDIKITTESDAGSFYLKATASNINHWQRYLDGYGQPFSFYMGGLINDVWTWDPRRTTQFDDVHSEDEYTYERVKFNDTADGAAQNDYYVKYPTIPIDITLTVNLTENSIIKAYMLGQSGYRWDGTGDAPVGLEGDAETTKGRIAYLLPEIIESTVDGFGYFQDTTSTLTNVWDLNLCVPVTGEYTFRYVGTVRQRKNSGDIIEYVNICTGKMDTCHKDALPANCYGISNANFVVDKLYVTTTASAKSFTVTFESNGGTEVESQTVEFGKRATTPADPTHLTDNTKEFAGWYSDEALTTLFDFGSGITKDITLYAKWGGRTYDITFDLNDGEWNTNQPVGDKITTGMDGRIPTSAVPTAKRTGYDFAGWKVDDTDTVILQSNLAKYAFEENTTLTAQWTKKVYSVTFNLNGLPKATTPAEQSVEYEETASEPTVIGMLVHYHLTWYNGNTEYDFESEVTGNLNLVAKWYADNGVYANDVFVGELNENTDRDTTSLRLKAEGVLLKAGDTVKFWWNQAQEKSGMFIRSNSPAANNMTPKTTANTNGMLTVSANCSGWYNMYYEENAGDGNEHGIWLVLVRAYEELNLKPDDGLYSNGELLSGFEVNEGASYELVAKSVWLGVKTTVTVKYNDADQTVSKLKDTSLGTLSNGNVTLNAGTYDFYYDYIDNALYIEGQAAQYTILYVNLPDDATNSNPLTYAVADGIKTLSNPTMPADKIFLGWTLTDASGSDVTQITPANIDSLSKGITTITLYANWDDLHKVTFLYNYDGAPDDGVYATISVRNRHTISETDMPHDPSREGFSFEGWFKEESCLNAWEAEDTVSADTDLYAKWKESAVTLYTVKFDVNLENGGSGSNTVYSNKQAGATVAKPSNPSPSNDLYEFVGWYDAAVGGNEVTLDDTITVSGNATYFAHYVATKLRIVINASELYNVNSDNIYHLYAWDSADNAIIGDWTERPLMTPMGDGKFSYVLSEVPSGFIVTLDRKDTTIEIGRYEVNSATGLTLGTEKMYTMNVASLSFDSDKPNQIGLVFNDGIIVLDAQWSTTDRPNQIYMWKTGGTITAGWNGSQAGDNIAYDKFTKYNAKLSDVYGIILAQNGNGWTGDITPGRTTDGVAYPSLENGKIYEIKLHTLTEKASGGGDTPIDMTKTVTIKDNGTVKATLTVLSGADTPYIWCWVDNGPNFTGGNWAGYGFANGTEIDINGETGTIKLIISKSSSGANQSDNYTITFTNSYDSDKGQEYDLNNGVTVFIKGMTLAK